MDTVGVHGANNVDIYTEKDVSDLQAELWQENNGVVVAESNHSGQRSVLHAASALLKPHYIWHMLIFPSL